MFSPIILASCSKVDKKRLDDSEVKIEFLDNNKEYNIEFSDAL